MNVGQDLLKADICNGSVCTFVLAQLQEISLMQGAAHFRHFVTVAGHSLCRPAGLCCCLVVAAADRWKCSALEQLYSPAGHRSPFTENFT